MTGSHHDPYAHTLVEPSATDLISLRAGAHHLDPAASPDSASAGTRSHDLYSNYSDPYNGAYGGVDRPVDKPVDGYVDNGVNSGSLDADDEDGGEYSGEYSGGYGGGHDEVRGDLSVAGEYGDWRHDTVVGGLEARSYVLTRGRTQPAHEFDMLSVVVATAEPHIMGRLIPPYDQLVDLCADAVTVAEISAQANLPLTVTKILLSDLLEVDAITARLPAFDDPKVHVLERVLDGLRRLTA